MFYKVIEIHTGVRQRTNTLVVADVYRKDNSEVELVSIHL